MLNKPSAITTGIFKTKEKTVSDKHRKKKEKKEKP